MEDKGLKAHLQPGFTDIEIPAERITLPLKKSKDDGRIRDP
jgi:hypothetical protein